MPFGLKNTGATYQRLVNKMFQKQIGTSIDVYIDDMLEKSVRAELHIAHMAELFQVLKNYNMKLNPNKYAFGVSAGKFLGFMVNNQEIEANLDKIKAVLDMHPPSKTKEIQRLTRKPNAKRQIQTRNSCFEPLCIQIQRQVPTILPGSEKGFPLGSPM